MANVDIPLTDFHKREYPYKSYKTMQAWAQKGMIRGAHKDLGGRWVVNISVYQGIDVNHNAVNDIGIEDEVFTKLKAL